MRFPHAPEPWIDLSTGVNGRPYPIGSLDPKGFCHLPEPSGIAALEAAAARAYGADPEAVVAVAGSQTMIQLLPSLVPARRVGVLDFSYAEHGRAWRRSGAEVEVTEHLESLAGFEVAVVVNPNNPDGRLVEPARLAGLVGRVGLLVVDEAFMDVMPPGSSLAPHRGLTRTVVLRSFGKSYGLAGLRLGFALASPDFVSEVRRAVGPWAVSGPALELGCRALNDAGWQAATTVRTTADALRLDALLTNSGAQILGGTPLFRLAEVGDGEGWFEHLGRAGILVRPFAERPNWLRFGIPAEDGAWARLAEALARTGP